MIESFKSFVLADDFGSSSLSPDITHMNETQLAELIAMFCGGSVSAHECRDGDVFCHHHPTTTLILYLTPLPH